MSSDHAPHSRHRRLALALVAAGLLLASLAVVDRRGVGASAAGPADPTFDPLLDGGSAGVCVPIPGALKLQTQWLLAVAAKTETAPFQPQTMKAASAAW